jgi:hypothetical protein
MAFWVEGSKGLPNGKTQVSYGMDSMADVASLPPMSDRTAPGSDAFAVTEKKLVMLNSNGEWV